MQIFILIIAIFMRKFVYFFVLPQGTNELTPAMKEIMMRKKKVAVSALKTNTRPATGMPISTFF